MTLKEKIAQIKLWQEVKNMQYPDDPTQWYMYSCVAKGWTQDKIKEQWKAQNKDEDEPPENLDYVVLNNDKYVLGKKHFQLNHFSYVFICIKRMGTHQEINLGCADLANKDFPETWKELVQAGKDRVDRLNSVDAALELGSPSQCAECNSHALEGDYLCGDCRARS